jgi:hypothetical protein
MLVPSYKLRAAHTARSLSALRCNVYGQGQPTVSNTGLGQTEIMSVTLQETSEEN